MKNTEKNTEFDRNSLARTARAVRAYERNPKTVGGMNPHRPVTSGGNLPTPQYQYMVLQAVAQNVLGADFVRCHPLI